jgi:hypothetical protein
VSNTRTKPKQQEDTPRKDASLNCFSLYKKFGHFIARETIKTQYFIKRTGISFMGFYAYNFIFFTGNRIFKNIKNWLAKYLIEKFNEK